MPKLTCLSVQKRSARVSASRLEGPGEVASAIGLGGKTSLFLQADQVSKLAAVTNHCQHQMRYELQSSSELETHTEAHASGRVGKSAPSQVFELGRDSYNFPTRSLDKTDKKEMMG